MQLWLEWLKCVYIFKDACNRERTFAWLVFALLGFSTLPDLRGVTGLARAAFLKKESYHSFLHFFHSPSLRLHKLTALWVRLALRLFKPVRHNGRTVLLLDGLKIPKEGKKMPGVKKLHQESADNSKAPYIFGHSLQAIALLAEVDKDQFQAVPLLSRIHEGIAPSPQNKKSLSEKVHELLDTVKGCFPEKVLFVADAFYSNKKIILPLLAGGHHLLSRVRHNTVAYTLPPKKRSQKKGRPRTYGERVVLSDLWKKESSFRTAPVSTYGGKPVQVSFLVKDLLWRPIKGMIRFILAHHPDKGRIILVTTDFDMDPVEAIRLYSARFKIEVSFKSSVHTIGVYAYRFWMRMWKPNKGRKGDQDLSVKSEKYRTKALEKIEAYHRFIQLGIIGHGLLLHLAINFKKQVWSLFPTWLRTMNVDSPPSEWVVAKTLKFLLPEFLLGRFGTPAFQKILAQKIDLDKIPGMKLSA